MVGGGGGGREGASEMGGRGLGCLWTASSGDDTSASDDRGGSLRVTVGNRALGDRGVSLYVTVGYRGGGLLLLFRGVDIGAV